jgi:hypothetical protein
MGNDLNAAERIADFPPSVEGLTDYDRANAVTYLRLLDADADGADWEAVAATVLNLDVDSNPERARSVWAANLKRAKWMTVSGFSHLLPDAGHSSGR